MKEALEALPEQFRMAVLLADVEGFSYKEIAEITGRADRHRDESAPPRKKAAAEGGCGICAEERGLRPGADRPWQPGG